MNCYFVLILLIELIHFSRCEVKSNEKQRVLSRKRRYLSFPEGSSIVVSNKSVAELSFVTIRMALCNIWEWTE